MRVGHRQVANRAIVENRALCIPNDFCAYPEALGLAREGELNLEPIARSVTEDRQGIEDHPMLTDARDEGWEHLFITDECRVEGYRNERLASSARSHALEATGSGFAGQETHRRAEAPSRADSKLLGGTPSFAANLV